MLGTNHKQTVIKHASIKICSKQEVSFYFGIDFDCETKREFMKDTDIDAFILGQKAEATKYKDNSDLNTFTRFCFSIKERRNIENIPEVQLNNTLCQIFINAKTKKGTFYEPDTLTGIRNSLQRVLVTRGSKIDLLVK